MSSLSSSHTFPSIPTLIIFLAPLLLLGSLSIDLYIPYVPLIPVEFQCSFTDTQLTLTIPMFMMGLSQLFWGRAIDRMGLLRSLFIALSFYIGGSILCWKTTQISIFLFARACQGIGACGAHVFAICIARMLTKEPQTSIVLGRLMGIAGTAPIFAPFLGLAMTSYVGSWRGVFFFLILYTSLIAFGYCLFYKSQLEKSLSNQKIEKIETSDSSVWSDIQEILQNRDFRRFALVPCLMLLGLILFFAFSTYYLQHTHSLDPMTFRLILSGHAAIYVVSSFVLAPIVAAHSEHLIFIGVSALLSLYASMYFMSSTADIPLPIFITVVFSLSTLYGALYGPSIQKTLQSISKNTGLATSILGTLQFTTASIITTFAFPSHAATISHFVTPLGLLATCSLAIMLYYRKTT